jgi:hypothetical protein
LRRSRQDKSLADPVDFTERTPSLHWDSPVAVSSESLFVDFRGIGEGCVNVAHVLSHGVEHVRREIRIQKWTCRVCCIECIECDWQRLKLDIDILKCVLGNVLIHSRDNRDRLTDIADDPVRKHRVKRDLGIRIGVH